MAKRAKLTGSTPVMPSKGRPSPGRRPARPPTRKLEDQVWYPILRLFALQKPEKKQGRDGETYEIYYRYGALGGAFTTNDLLDKCGYLGRLERWENEARKLYGVGTKRFMEERARCLADLKGELSSAITQARKRLKQECAPLVPLFTKARIHSEDDEPKLYIQGYVRLDAKKEKFVIGNRDDGVLWSLETKKRTESPATAYATARLLGREFMAHQNLLAAPIRERLLDGFKEAANG